MPMYSIPSGPKASWPPLWLAYGCSIVEHARGASPASKRAVGARRRTRRCRVAVGVGVVDVGQVAGRVGTPARAGPARRRRSIRSVMSSTGRATSRRRTRHDAPGLLDDVHAVVAGPPRPCRRGRARWPPRRTTPPARPEPGAVGGPSSTAAVERRVVVGGRRRGAASRRAPVVDGAVVATAAAAVVVTGTVVRRRAPSSSPPHAARPVRRPSADGRASDGCVHWPTLDQALLDDADDEPPSASKIAPPASPLASPVENACWS